VINLRILRSISLASFDAVGQTLDWLQRATQDALDVLDASKAPVLTMRRSELSPESVQYSQHLFSSGNRVNLPSSLTGAMTVGISNIGVSTLGIYPHGSDTVMGTTSATLSSHTTIRLTSDGAGGWW
jgi:hypothetical protein